MSSIDSEDISVKKLKDELKEVSNEIILNGKEETSEETSSSEFLRDDTLNSDAKTDSDMNEESSQQNMQGENEDFSVSDDDSTSKLTDDGWLDIIGSGDFKKKIIKDGKGTETRPTQGSSVIINFSCYKENELIEKFENFEVFVGELDVIPAFDLFIPLMEEGEIAEVLVPSRLAFGKAGRQSDIPPDCPLRYEVEVIKVDNEISEDKLSPLQAMALGEKKKERGNFWFIRGDYLNSITCYKRATEILDSIKWDGNEEVKPEVLQCVLEARTKVYNNMAAAQFKMEVYDQALKSVDCVIRLQPKNCKAQYRKGKILAAKGLTEEAITAMKKAIELEPETKIIQLELKKLLDKKIKEDKIQRAMYKRMFPSSPSKSRASKVKKWLKHGSLIAGSFAALAISIAAYRQFYS